MSNYLNNAYGIRKLKPFLLILRNTACRSETMMMNPKLFFSSCLKLQTCALYLKTYLRMHPKKTKFHMLSGQKLYPARAMVGVLVPREVLF